MYANTSHTLQQKLQELANESEMVMMEKNINILQRHADSELCKIHLHGTAI